MKGFVFRKKLIVVLLLMFNVSMFYGQCGTCAVPDCIIAESSDFNSAEAKHDNWSPSNSFTFCEEYSPSIIGPAVNTTYHTITIGTSGELGAVVSSYAGGNFGCIISRVYRLYPIDSLCNVANVINPTTTNANGSSYENPEWSGLTPGATYKLRITYTIPSGCEQIDNCQVFYSPDTIPNVGCTANVGTTVVTIEGDNVSGDTEYDVCLGDEIIFSQTGVTLQSSTDPIVGYAVLDCAPTAQNPFDDACFLGNDLTTSSTINTGGFTGNTYWFVPLTFDVEAEEDPDFDNNGCYGKGTPIKVNFLSTTCVTPPTGCTCSSPDCANDYIPNPATPTFTACNEFGYFANDTTFINYYTIKSSADGTLGILQQLISDAGNCSTTEKNNILSGRTYALYPLNDCNGSPISATTANAGYSSTLNPEWDNLTASTDYILKVTVVVPNASCGIEGSCLDYYYPVGINPTCDCNTPNCPIYLTNDGSASPSGTYPASNMITYNEVGPTTITQCHTVTVPASGLTLGFRQYAFGDPCVPTGRTYQLKAADSNGQCTGAAITKTGNGPYSATFNPEWDNLAPGDYILCVTFTLTSGCGLDETSTGYYIEGCPANAGNVVSSTTGNASTSALNQHILCPNATVNITSSGYTLPSNAGGGLANADMGYTIYSCEPPATPDPLNDACAYKISGVPVVLNAGAFTSDINDGSTIANFTGATNQTYWIVPITLKSGDPDLLIDSDCFDAGTPVKVTYLNQITTEDSVKCNLGEVEVTISGGYLEFFSGTYTLTNTGDGTLSSTTVTSNGGKVTISGLQDGDIYSFDIVDNNGCPVSYTGGTFVSCGCVSPTVVANIDSISLCLGDSLTLSASGADSTYNWNPNTVANDEAFAPTETEMYIVTGINSGGCVGKDTVYVSVEDVTASFTLISNGGVVPYALDITNTSTNSDFYRWFFGNSDTSNLFEPSYSYLISGEYNLFLIASNDLGCIDTSEVIKITTLDGCVLEIPTAFTPDNNGQNDTWIINCIENYPSAEVSVYNRWGTKVYSSIGGTGYIPWDGNELPVGSYYYVLTIEGEEPTNGTITLIK